MTTHDDSTGRRAGHDVRVDDDAGKPARWRIVGPGLVVAATGVGAADMVATLVAGSRYGYALLWAVILGVVLKIVLVEGAGRFGMFLTVVGLAVIAVPNVPDMLAGLVPVIPDGGLLYTLAVAGGVGGTITLAAYGYWLREKGWYTPKWMKVMRIDNSMAC